MYAKSIDFRKKVFTSWIRTHDLLDASQLLYPLSYMAVVFDGMLFEFFSTFLSSTRYRMQADLTVTNLEVGGWVYGVRQLICQSQQSQASYWHERQTDGRTGFQLYIYIEECFLTL